MSVHSAWVVSLQDYCLQVMREARQQAERRQEPVLASCTIMDDSRDIVDLFDKAHPLGEDRYLWIAPQGLGLLGVGGVWSVSPGEAAAAIAQCFPCWSRVLGSAVVDVPVKGKDEMGPLLIGGAAFDQSGAPARSAWWHGFPRFRFVLPRIIYARIGETGWFTFNWLIEPQHDLRTELQRTEFLYQSLTDPDRRPRQVPTSESCHLPVPRQGVSFRQWREMVESAVLAIRNGVMSKVVLARHLPLWASAPFNPTAALRQLHTEYTNCYLFAFCHDRRCFLGATPERLVCLQNRAVQVAALAATAGRGTSLVEDERLGRLLLKDDKAKVEHRLVVDMITAALEAVCEQLHIPPRPGLVKLPNVQHLYTPISGMVRPGLSVLDLVERLHPTPAVGGLPRQIALDFVRRHESWDRGWYAGPVGWMDRNGSGEFAVAIRSGLVAGDRAVLFAGCGIVADSDPEQEYREASLKLQPLARVLERSTAGVLH